MSTILNIRNADGNFIPLPTIQGGKGDSGFGIYVANTNEIFQLTGVTAFPASGGYSETTLSIPYVSKNGSNYQSFICTDNYYIYKLIDLNYGTQEQNPYIVLSNTGCYIKGEGGSGGDITDPLKVAHIETGEGIDSYFQSRKFRGEGTATSYYHAIDFGHAGHDMVEFYEYGGDYIFNECKTGNKENAVEIFRIKPDGLYFKGSKIDTTPPQRGVDYWTTEDKQEIENYCQQYMDEYILGGAS